MAPDREFPSGEELTPHQLYILLARVLNDHEKDIEGQEKRIRRIEAIMYLGLGASATAGSLVGSVLSNLVGG